MRIAEEYVALHGRSNLDNFLRNTIPDQNFQPGDLHDQALKLPWADVFTTNWDTLLERTARRLIDRRYKLVLETTDIPLKSQPRIIKLHGTFPSNGPFILTEEDFRTYPQKFAPFVNMVQQSMTENIFCLVGFSGDDPNFLSWSGWVRDNLGDHAPRLYLVILRGLRQGERKMLESRGIIPIDLSQVFLPSTNVADGDRHQVALSWFFDNLKAGEPPSRIDWPRPADASPSATPGLASIPPYPGDGPLDESFRPR